MKLSFLPIFSVWAVALVACVPDQPDDAEADEHESADSNPVTEATEPEAMTGMTAAQNEVRAAVSPAPKTPLPALVWDEDLAAVAQAYADQCVYRHSMGEYGENLFAQAGKEATVDEVVEAWGPNEAKSYDYATNTCAKDAKCGHYTQMVWRDSTRLGCGVANCKTGSPFEGFTEWQYWVCNYDPAGNWQGEKPY